MDIQRYFEILELDSKASPDEVKQAYRDLVNVWHPDRFPGNPRLKQKAEEKLKEINEAYERALSFLSSEGESLPSEGESEKTTSQFYSNQETSGETSAASQIRPWVRCLARSIDYLLFGFFLISINVNRTLSKFDIPIIIFPALLIFIWIFVEAGFLSIFGTTPGKWLLRTRVVNIFQHKPDFLSALRRSLSVWCNGMGVGIPFITPITMVISYYKLRRERHAVWDLDGGFFVKHSKISISMALLAVLFFIIFSFLNTYKMQRQIKIVVQDMAGYKRAIQARSDYAETSYKKGAVYAELGRYEEAIESYKQAISGKPDYTEASYKLGAVYAELGRYEEAIESYKQVIRSKPDYAEVQYSLGFSYAKLHLHEEAIKALKQAIQIRPDYAEAHHILGFMYLIAGNRNAALEQYGILNGLDKDLADELFKYIESISPLDHSTNSLID
ncbi:MAG: tetratricopeptide repeat protein [Desulfobacterales bacterium]|nr:tetratricopeptide repeat protein [Desulfobacterales bacterium]